MKSRWIKLCSILLVLTMLINMLSVSPCTEVYAQGKLCGNENRKASYADKAETVLQMGNPI